MKRSKIFAGILLSLLLIVSLFSPALAAPTPAEAAQLRFDENGRFRVMILADIQDGKSVSPITKTFIRETAKNTQPDLIVLTGDNIYGSATKNPAGGEKGLRSVMNMLQDMYDEGYGAPVAATFGNHDDQSNNYAKEDQMKVISEYPCSISIDEDLWVDGDHYTEALEHCGTFNVPVLASGSDDVKFNFWVLDSGAYAEDGNKGYDHVREKQLNWLRKTAEKLGNVNSIAFQHIIMPEIYNSYEKTEFSAGAGVYNYHGTYYKLPDTAKPGSVMGEASACSEDNGGEYDVLKSVGGVIACVSGHDHVNSFVIPNADPDFRMDWINCPTCGVASYGQTATRGIRIIDLNEADTSTYETQFFTYKDVMGGDAGFMLRYRFVSFFTQLEYRFINLWMQLTNLLGISNLVA